MNNIFIISILFCVGCTKNGLPEEGQEPNEQQQEILSAIEQRWENSEELPPIGNCQDFLNRALVLEANRNQMLTYCWRCPPTEYDPDCKPKYGKDYGRAYSCMTERSTCTGVGTPFWKCESSPILVLYEGMNELEMTNAVQHEFVHALSGCVIHDAYSHSNPLVWGANGVFPL